MSEGCPQHRDHNEVLYLQETLALVNSLLARETHDDGFEVVGTERRRRERGICVSGTVRQAELTQGELYRELCFAVIRCCCFGRR